MEKGEILRKWDAHLTHNTSSKGVRFAQMGSGGPIPRSLQSARVGPLKVIAGLSESIHLRSVIRKGPVSVAPHSVAAPRPLSWHPRPASGWQEG